jgi:DNA-binding transcriptional ArsR family regulator
LQGFFAGEGNLKYIISTKSRVLRISQGRPNLFIESIFNKLNLNFVYSPDERAYTISGRENLERLWKMNISILHPLKHSKFRIMLETYRQRHLKKGDLREKLLEFLERPKTSKEIAKILNKSQARVTRVLVKLGKEGLVKKYRSRSLMYWIRSNINIIVISRTKYDILRMLSRPRRVYEISNLRNSDWKSSFRRLKELEKLNLVKE